MTHKKEDNIGHILSDTNIEYNMSRSIIMACLCYKYVGWLEFAEKLNNYRSKKKEKRKKSSQQQKYISICQNKDNQLM